MTIFWLLTLLLANSMVAQTSGADEWNRAVEIMPEPIKLGENGVELVTIRMKIKPGFYVCGPKQPEGYLIDLEPKLVIKSKDPGTRLEVTFPRAQQVVEDSFRWTKYEGNIAIAAVVHRAAGDNSPLEGTLWFRPGNGAT